MKTFSAILFALLIWSIPLSAFSQDEAPQSDDDSYSAMSSAGQKQVAVVEHRPFSKAGRGEIALGLGTIASDVFLVYLPVTLRGAYHIKEWIAVEAAASFMGCYGDSTGPNLERASEQRCHRVLKSSFRRLTEEDLDMTHVSHVVIQEYQTARFSADAIWSPVMGKFALGNSVIAHFDLNLAAGLGVVLVEQIMDESGSREIKASFEGNLGVGTRMVFMDRFGVRLDFREYLYGKQEDRGMAAASELTLSFSVML